MEMQIEGLDMIDEIGEMKMTQSEDRRTFTTREHEFGGHGKVAEIPVI